MSNGLKKKICEAVARIRKKTKVVPDVAVILGTGLGGFAREIDADCRIDYRHIPHFPESTVISHAGEFVVGKVGGKSVVAMDGRFHFYEGHTLEQITFPVRVMRALGASILIVSNACGGLNPKFGKGAIMLIDDHINLMGVNPLVGPNDDSLGPRFPDMCRPYDPRLLALAERIAREKKIAVRRGVYAAMTGPCLETRAEYRMLKTVGADAIGMSTVPEVIVGVHCGFRIFGISVVTDLCDPDNLKPADIHEIIATANQAEPKVTAIVGGLIARA